MNDSQTDAQSAKATQTPEPTSQGFSPIPELEIVNMAFTKFISHICRLTTPRVIKKKRRIKREPFNRAEYLKQVRTRMIAAYGGKCVCCGEQHQEFMTIDHIFGDGKQDRQKYGGGHAFYRHLERNGFPKDRYRLLCMNCNFVRRFGKKCPHEIATPMVWRRPSGRMAFNINIIDSLNPNVYS